GLHRAAAPQARRVAHRDRARARLSHGGRRVSALSLRARVMIGAVLWTIGLLTVASVVGVIALLGHPIQHAFVLHAFSTHPGESLVVAMMCLVLGFWQVKKGLSALDRLRERLGVVREGREQQVTGTFPAEVDPLVHDLNARLVH